MSLDPRFREASEAAESWCGLLADARYFIEQGQARVAYGLLLDAWYQSIHYWPVLRDASDDLAAFSGGVIRYHGAPTPRCYAHAHEAIFEVVFLMDAMFLSHLRGITDKDELEAAARRLFAERAEGLMVATSEIRARIRLERGKLLRAEAASPGAPAAPHADNGRLTPQFEDATQTVHFAGQPHKVTDPRAYLVYRMIVEACPHPVTKARIRAKVSGVKGTKTIPALLGKLPGPLRATVQDGTNGYWYDQSPVPKRSRPPSRKKRR